MINIKQLFCDHIWKEVSDDFLRTERIQVPYGYLSLYHTYSFYALKSVCIKCNKSEIYEHRKLHLYNE